MSTIQAQMKTVLNDFDKCCVTAIYTQFFTTCWIEFYQSINQT